MASTQGRGASFQVATGAALFTLGSRLRNAESEAEQQQQQSTPPRPQTPPRENAQTVSLQLSGATKSVLQRTAKPAPGPGPGHQYAPEAAPASIPQVETPTGATSGAARETSTTSAREQLLASAKKTKTQPPPAARVARPRQLSAAAMSRLNRTTQAAPEPEPEPELGALGKQLLARRRPPALRALGGSSGPDASLPSFENETDQLLRGGASNGPSRVGVALNVMRFNRKMHTAVAPVVIESIVVVDAILEAGSMRVQYKIETRYRYDDERQVQGQKVATTLHFWKDLVEFYVSLRGRHPNLPELSSLDGSDAAQAYTDVDAHAERSENIEAGRRRALNDMFHHVLQRSETVNSDHAVLELLAIRHQQEHGPQELLGPGWSKRRLLKRNPGSSPMIPQRVLDQIEADRKFRATHLDDEDDTPEEVRTLDMWGIYRKNQSQDRQVVCCSAVAYVVYWLLLMLQLGKMPTSAGLMKHQEAIEDLVLDEEFPGVSFKKNFHDIMTEDEMWQWADGPLTAAFYPDDTSEDPQPLLYSNVLVGSVQIRQVRVSDTPCTGLVVGVDHSAKCAPRWAKQYVDNSPYGGINGATYQSMNFDSVLEGSRVFSMSTTGDTAPENFGDQGYAVSLPRNRTSFIKELHDLRSSGAPFVDKRTRALSFQFNLLNGNDMGMPAFGLNLLGFQLFEGWSPYDNTGLAHILTVQITFVLDATGHWDRVHRVYAMAPMQEYFFGVDWVFWSWIVMWVWILVLDINRYLNQGFKLFFKSGLDAAWNKFDLGFSVLLVYLFIVTWQVHEYTLDQMEVMKLNDSMDKFTDLFVLRSWMKHLSRVFGVISFLSVVKFLKYLNGIEQISFMWRVVGSAKMDLLAFATVFVLLLLSFALLCKMLWGASERHFHNIPTTFVSLLRMTVGALDFDYLSMKEHEPRLAPVFLVLFMFVMMLISINFFIAILTESYSKKKEQVSKYIAYKKAERQMNMTSTSITRVFPTFTVQEHPAPWPDPHKTGAKKVLSVSTKFEHGGPEDAAHIICLHLFKENIAGRKLAIRTTQHDKPIQQLDGESDTNFLNRPDVTCAAYLQIVQNVGTATHILFELRQDDVITLKESGSFGKVIKCKLLHHFTRTKDTFFGGVPEKHVDYYANLEVVSVTSWESFDTYDGVPRRGTRLTPQASGDWSRSDDDALRANSVVMEKWRHSDNGDLDYEKPSTPSELAELLGKPVDAVILRTRLLEHWELSGIEEPPKVLAETISLSTGLTCRLWWRAIKDSSRNEYSVSAWLISLAKRVCVCKTGIEQDVEAFFRALLNDRQAQCNMRDVEKAKQVFRAANVPVDELTYRMQLYLKLSGARTDEYLRRTYTHLDDDSNTHMQWLSWYIDTQYADQIIISAKPDLDEEGSVTHNDEELVQSINEGNRASVAVSSDADELDALLEEDERDTDNSTSGWEVARAAYRSPAGLEGRTRIPSFQEVAEQGMLRLMSKDSVPKSPSKSERSDPAEKGPSAGTTPPQDALQELQTQVEALKQTVSVPANASPRLSRTQLIAHARMSGAKRQGASSQRNMYL